MPKREYIVSIDMNEAGKVRIQIEDVTTNRTYAVNTEDFARLNPHSSTPEILGETIVGLFRDAEHIKSKAGV